MYHCMTNYHGGRMLYNKQTHTARKLVGNVKFELPPHYLQLQYPPGIKREK